MRAVLIRRFGGPEVLEIVERPVPQPDTRQVRIAVEAAAVNPVDIATRAGWLAEHGLIAANEPISIGWDLAGVIDAVGPDVDRYRIGDPVIGMRDLLSAPIGAQAECVVLDTDAVAPAPQGATAAEASTLPLNGLTASQPWICSGLNPVSGCWSRGLPAHSAVSRSSSRSYAGCEPSRSLRDETRHSSESWVPTSSLSAGTRLLTRSAALCPEASTALDAAVIGMPALDAVRDGGSFVAVAAGSTPVPLRGTRVHNVWIRTDSARLAELAALVDAGRLTLRVASTGPLDSVDAAHERLAAGGLRGRIVLLPNGSPGKYAPQSPQTLT
jgi:NADPH2:quinone reductase